MIAQDGNVVFSDGGPYSLGSDPNYVDTISLQFVLREARESNEIQAKDGRAWGDTDQALRATFRAATISLDLMIIETGELDIPLGNWVRAEIFTGGSSSSRLYEGFLLENSGKYIMDSVSMQTIVIRGQRLA